MLLILGCIQMHGSFERTLVNVPPGVMIYTDEADVPKGQCQFINKQLANLFSIADAFTHVDEGGTQNLVESECLELDSTKPSRTLESLHLELDQFYRTGANLDDFTGEPTDKPPMECQAISGNVVSSSGGSGSLHASVYKKKDKNRTTLY